MAAEKKERREPIKLTDVVKAEFEALRRVYKPPKKEVSEKGEAVQ